MLKTSCFFKIVPGHAYGKEQDSKKWCGEHRKYIRKNEECRRVKNWKEDGKNGKEEDFGQNLVV